MNNDLEIIVAADIIAAMTNNMVTPFSHSLPRFD